MINVGVIGYGYWGPNIVRNFTQIKETKVSCICDQSPDRINQAQESFPFINTSTNEDDIFSSDDIQAVAIVTPVSTHFELAKKALEHDKHVFVEKPFTANVAQAEELIALADQKGLKIMVDHTFIFTGAVQKIKEVIDNDDLGDLNYYDSTRVSLGLFQHDVNVIWDLAPHDFSIMDYVIKNKPIAIQAQGAAHFENGYENIAYITVYFENNLIGHINANWLSPVKVRTTLIGGQKKILVWDDLKPDEKIKIYDRGVHVESKEGIHKLLVEYRSGDMWSPRIEHQEALKKELEYFVHCIEQDERPINDGRAGLRVVQMLELTDQSLKNDGKLIEVRATQWVSRTYE